MKRVSVKAHTRKAPTKRKGKPKPKAKPRQLGLFG